MKLVKTGQFVFCHLHGFGVVTKSTVHGVVIQWFCDPVNRTLPFTQTAGALYAQNFAMEEWNNR